MNKDAFLKEVTRRLEQVFGSARDGYKVPPVQRHRLEGFMQAGVFLGLASNEELQQLMETTHVSIFGKTIKEREAQRPVAWQESALDYREYEQPTFTRRP
ncbi:hypothetical protein [Motiliproteus sp. SC1-56]|uniref:hypothetical protein n=1 Tax=Motiliproteus sp. SC1-56 TaxID=2799565 RepID=UPI001A8F98D8|nr:hypothetical protein [Motiliproteus sp. SC1-56]